MPKIPQFTNQRGIQSRGVSPGAMAAPYSALAQAGEKVTDLGDYLSRIDTALKKAERTVRAAEIESVINNGFADAAESFRMRSDFEHFDDDAQKIVRDLQSQYTETIGNDPVLKRSVDLAFRNKSADFLRTINAKKAEQITNRGKGRLEGIINDSIDQYAKAQTPEERKLIKDRLSEITTSFAESNIITFRDAELYLEKFDNDSEDVRADQYIEADPEAALKALKGGSFDALSPKIRQDKIEKAQSEIDKREREQRLSDDRLSKALEKIRKKVIEKNDLDSVTAFYDDTLKESDLDTLASNQMVSESTYKWLKNKLREGDSGPKFNNPITVGDITEAIEYRAFDTAMELLDTALAQDQIKTETYINLRKSLANESYSDAVKYLNMAMKPSDLEVGFFNRQRQADAFEEMNKRIAGGENPQKAANSIIRLYKADLYKQISLYRKPKYLEGDQSNMIHLADAKYKTVEAYKRGELNETQYKIEIDLIEEIEQARKDLERFNEIEKNKDLDKAMQDFKVGR